MADNSADPYLTLPGPFPSLSLMLALTPTPLALALSLTIALTLTLATLSLSTLYDTWALTAIQAIKLAIQAIKLTDTEMPDLEALGSNIVLVYGGLPTF